MRPGARAQAAMEILADVEARRRPAAEATKDWMLSHRFAGSRDRAEIGDLVFAGLRWKQSSAWRLDEDTPRAWVFGALRWGFGLSADEVATLCRHDPHGPPEPGASEFRRLECATLDDAPPHVAGDYPEWLDASLARAFGEERAAEGAALAAPAALDLRANTLKVTREKLAATLRDNPNLKTSVEPTPFAPDGLRLAWRRGGNFAWASDQSFVKGWFEVQDEGSQIAALLCDARPGLQVADVCAGGGGKTLALAAAMQNKGQVYAFDVDGRRLAPLHERLDRAGVRNVQIRAPAKSRDVLADLVGKMDVVLVDAPCTGSGTWRRAPDTKWRLRPNALSMRLEEQQQALALAAPLVKPGGRLVYVTCSVLPEENADAVTRFLSGAAGFQPATLSAPSAEITGLIEKCRLNARGPAIQLTPRRAGTDGFFVAALQRA